VASLIAKQPWYRFSDYEIVEDVIRPAAGARFEQFDMSELWSDSSAGRDDYISPTQAAIALLGDIEAAEGTPADRVQRQEALILSWCRRYGLLGLIGFRVLQLSTPARWVGEHDAWEHIEIMRLGGTWIWRGITASGEDAPHDSGGVTFMDESLIVDGLPRAVVLDAGFADHLVARFFPASEQAAMRETDSADLSVLESEDFWSGYMRSETFWRAYGEEMADFTTSLRRLRGSLERWSNGSTSGTRPGLNTLLHWLNYAAAGVSLAPVRDGDEAGLRFMSSSLLALMAVAGAQDLAGEWRMLECRCGRPFLARHHLQKWHSESCREMYKKRDLRARVKKERTS